MDKNMWKRKRGNENGGGGEMGVGNRGNEHGDMKHEGMKTAIRTLGTEHGDNKPGKRKRGYQHVEANTEKRNAMKWARE